MVAADFSLGMLQQGARQLTGLLHDLPQTAAKIIAFRQEHGPFHSVDELDAVPGIGPSRIEQLKGLVLP